MSVAATLTERLAALSPKKRALLERELQERGLLPPPQAIVARTERQASYPLSPTQQRMWFLHQLAPESPVYNVFSQLAIAGGEVAGGRLRRAFAEVIRRHEALRTRFVDEDGVPAQVVEERCAVDLAEVDLSVLTPGDRETVARRLAGRHGSRPFDLRRGPLVRTLLVRLGPDVQRVCVAMHHIVSDGWSMSIFYRELMALYGAFSSGQPSPLPELALQYVDFALWQRRALSGAMLDEHLGWWREQLAGAPPELALPWDRAYPAAPGHRGGAVGLTLPAPLTTALRQLARTEKTTLFIVLLAVFQSLLARWSGADDIVVGSPIAGRHHPETEPLIGFFVNTLVLRTRLEPGIGLRDLLAKVQAMHQGATLHQDLPFERLVEELRPERRLERSPIFQVSFAFQRDPSLDAAVSTAGAATSTTGAAPGSGGLRIQELGGETESVPFDFGLTLLDQDRVLMGGLSYRTELFDRTTVLRLSQHFLRLLAAAAAAPEARVDRLPLLTPGEAHQLGCEWNPYLGDVRGRETAAGSPDPLDGYDREATIPRLFEAWARSRPQAPALSFGEAELGYGELERRANQLAHFLRRLGVGPEVAVALALERSPEMIVAILGVLKTGGFFVPLDVSYPPGRLGHLLETTGAQVVLTTRALAARLSEPSAPGPRRVVLDDVAAALAAEPSDPVAGPARAESLAYVMFTSGSTGKPKGVAVTHRAVVRLVRRPDFARLDDQEVFLHLSSPSFDASTLELWAPLLNGGRLVLFPPERPSLARLGAFVRAHGVTSLWLTAGLFHQMVDSEVASLEGLRQLLAGGDVLSPAHVRRVLDEVPGLTLINGYGPTENTTFTCCHPLRRGAEVRAPVPIGRPIAHTGVAILDRLLQPVAIGVVGDLHAAGDGLARGYFGAPRASAERFIPDPASLTGGERLYRTGDRARWLADGVVEFLGRIDHQVKVRGFRIELEEVEAALHDLKEVRAAAVLAQEVEAGGGKRLVAFVVGDFANEAPAPGLRAALAEVLPDYMVPALFVPLEELPLNANGKVDRKALAERLRAGLETVPGAEERGFVAPRTPTEITLAAIWSAILRVPRVGLDDNFFDLGGHSLLATQVVSRLRRELGVEVPLQRLFETRTLAELAASLETTLGSAPPPAPPIARAPRDRPLPLSFAQQRLWFIDQLTPGSAAYNVPLAMAIDGALDAGVLGRAIAEIVRRHEVLRTVMLEGDGAPRQQVAAGGVQPLPVVDLARLGAPAAELRRLAAAEARRPFDLARGPIFRSVLLRQGASAHVLLACVHHVAADAWSLGILRRELTVLYTAFAAGRPSPLPELPLQYADYAAWQRGWLTGEVLASQLEFWKERLAGAPATLELPADRPRPAVQSFRGRSTAFELGAEIGARLEELARAERASLFMVLLAVYYLLLARSSGQDDVVIGTPIANRGREETEGLIGFFLNTLALRVRAPRVLSGRALVAEVRAATLGGFAHQDLPFEKLVEELDPERDLSRHPIFQAMFALQHPGGDALEIPGLTFRPIGSGELTAKFDWNLALWESPRGPYGALEYATDLFDAATAMRAVRHYRVLAAALAQAPERQVFSLPLLEPSERHQLLAEHGPAGDPGVLPTVMTLFERQVERSPDAIAIVAGAAALSYRELAARAHHLAHELRARGVGPDVAVGISCPRSLEMGIAVLGVLAAGGACVPLDPAYPRERLDYMVENSRAPVVLTAESLRELAGRSDQRPAPGVSGANLFYVIYTSGSTGKPKGVSLPHAALSNLLLWHLDTLRLGARALQFASLSFDASFHEMFGVWTNGGTLLMITEELRHDPEALGRFLAAERVEKVVLPVVLLQRLAELFPSRSELPLSLREIVATGEQLHVTPPVARFVAGLPGCSFHNHYGPSETHVVTAHTLAGPAERWPSHPPIGRPLPFCPCHVLDRWGEIAALGVAGELFLGGIQLARGYLGRPALSAEKFVPHPLAGALGEPGARLYRTGDLARVLTDGSLEYLGRIDHQVKIRGYRVELGEVEGALTRHPELRQAVVVADRDRAGYYRLVAYVVPEPGSAPSAAALRDFLRTGLPDFMLPAVFVFLDALPLSANQKVDRKRLPAPEESPAESAGAAPRTPVEQGLAAIWCQVLGRERVTVADNFFLIGGHSLLATQVSSRVRQVFGVELPVRALFETPTLEGLARQLERALEAGRPVAPPILPAPRGGEIPLSFAQERMWFVEQLLPGLAINHLPAVVRLWGPLDVPALVATLGEILRRHEVLRTGLVAEGGRPRQKIAPPAPFVLPQVDLGRLEPAVRVALARRLAAALARRPFDLARGPFLRASLLRLAADDHVVPFVMHHVASDGWSQGVLVSELGVLYDACHQRRPSPLPELAVQYADFAIWQRGWLAGEVLAGELAYWREQLRGLPPTLELPTDRPRPLTPGFAGARLALEIAPALTAGLHALAARSGATLFMVLLAAVEALLYRHTGQEDFAIGTPIAGRNRAEIEGLIGFFINTQVLRATLSERTSFAALLAQARERALGAYVHQDLPFEKLVEELQPERSLGLSPFFQVMLALQNAPGGTLELADLRLTPFGGGEAEVRTDLGLNFYEAGGAILGQLGYKHELFDATTAERLRRHFLALLAAVLAAPERALGELALLAAPERHQLLAEWNDWRAEAAVERTVSSVLADGLETRAERVALTAGEASWSYAELFGRAHALAHRLRALGAGPERFVGVCLERSPEWLIALLAVIESGAIYLPLDPHLPPERLAFMLEDAQTTPRLVVSDAARRALLPSGLEIVELGAERGAELAPPPPPLARPESPLYTIYTSGSTGIPKGVVITHRAVATRIAWSRRYDAVPVMSYLAKAMVGFDVSLLETLVPLGLGGRVVLVPPGGQWDVPHLLGQIARGRLSHAGFPPSMHAVLLEQPALERLRSLEVIYTAAEEIKSDLVDRILERVDAPLVNRYGPTEITIAALGGSCEHGDRGRAVPIGRPLGGARAVVLDRALYPVPIGVMGELAIGGPGLARGYLRRPATTAAVFVPDPFSAVPGERLYRTGDLARARADGRVEFHGRVDRQVKVRGFRIELGEVEAALRSHPAVVEAVVVDRKETSGLTQLAAWVVAAEGSTIDGAQLRGFVAERLPEYMVPAAIGRLAELPRMPSGKVDRHELRARKVASPAAVSAPVSAAAAPVLPPGGLEAAIAEIWREVLGREQVGAEENFFDLGGHSLLLVRVQSRLREALGLEVPMIELFRAPTIATLAGALRQLGAVPVPRAIPGAVVRRARPTGSAIAVVGLAGRFPGADDVEQFWHNLREGVESISFYTRDELAAAGVPPALLDSAAYVPAMGRLEDVDRFDAGLFGMSPREAQLTDPQQRLFLECAFAALEDAGCDPDGFAGPIGVFGGVGLNRYWSNLLANPETMASVGFLAATLGNDKDFLPTRVSYKLNLRGPSVNVQTACSTALVAVHLACRSLQGGECDLALAGGVSATAGEITGYLFEPDGILSPDGHCRAYDARAEGTVGGQGVGIAVLKRLDDALRDGDPIRAVIRGSALNNDGSLKVGFTAPSVAGQAQVIREALAAAEVEPATVGMIEGHGSATPIGDPIEVTALLEVFGGLPAASCALGAVKTNVGHVGAAAGLAGLAKAVLALEHGEIPPSLHFEHPNPAIDFASGPFYVPTAVRPWPAALEPRRAGVSSFGLGGTNAHVVLEQAPAREPSGPSRPWQLLLISAATETALETATDRLAAHLEAHPELPLADVACTLRTGRRRLKHRRALVCRDTPDGVAALAARDPRRLLGAVEERGARPVALLFPGLGDHYPQMARELYDTEPTFRAALDRCAEGLAARLGCDLRTVLFPGPAPVAGTVAGDGGGGGPDLRRLLGRAAPVEDPARARLDATRIAQPAVFAVEWALAALLGEWGIVPEAMIGYSLGEFTAAAVAGVFTLDDALRVVAERAALIDELPPGAMLAVPLGEDELRPLLGEELSFAAQNGPKVSVAAGPAAAIEALERTLSEREIASQRLRTSHAFHSREMEAIAPRFAALLARVELHAPRIPYLSNVTGTWIRPEQARDPEYWLRHLCGTVRFADGLEQLLGGGRALIEVGPGQALATAARQHPARTQDAPIVATLRDEREPVSDLAFLLGSLGRLWLAGVRPDWHGFDRHERRLKVRLPGYPFERQRHFLEVKPPAAPARPAVVAKTDVADWFYVPVWRFAAPPAAASAETLGAAGPWLLIDGGGVGEALAARLQALGQEVSRAAPGEPLEPVLGALAGAGRAPRAIVHLGLLGTTAPAGAAGFEAHQAAGVYRLLELVQALSRLGLTDPLRLAVVADRLHRVDTADRPEPAKTTVLGLLRVLPQEFRNLAVRSIELETAAPDDLEALLAELAAPAAPAERTIAWRSGVRRVEGFDPLRLPPPAGAKPGLRERGVYLLTGGFGRVGGIVAHYLAERVQARLVLLGRTACPPREHWDEHLAAAPAEAPASQRILLVRALEAAGAEVLPLAADVTDPAQLDAALAQTRECFGALHGVFHLAGNTRPDQLMVSVETTGVETCRRQFDAKVQGLYALDAALDAALGGEKLDFRVLFSSLSSVLGGLGFAAYAAANAFLDGFAQTVPGWLAIDWDGFRRTEEPAGRGETTMAPRQAGDALHRLLAVVSARRVVVAVSDLEPRLDRWVRLAPATAAEPGAPEPGAGAPGAAAGARPALATPFVAPRDPTETRIAEVWRDLLGIAEIGIHDNFFELGGDSLVATQLISRLRRALHVELPLQVFFQLPTVAQLAARLGQGAYRQEELSEIEAMLAEIKELSPEEEAALLAELEREEGAAP